MRISDWSSDVCSSDLVDRRARRAEQRQRFRLCVERVETLRLAGRPMSRPAIPGEHHAQARPLSIGKVAPPDLEQPHARRAALQIALGRSEEHTSELQSLMRISYAVFCLKKKTQNQRKIAKQ